MNIRDIARIANVTPGTVSKVLNNYPDISEATRLHVLHVIEENKYNTSKARGTKAIFSIPRIGLVTESAYNWIYGVMKDILSIRFHNAGYTILSFNDNYYSQDKTEKFNELTNYLKKQNITGVVYFGGDFRNITEEMFSLLPCPVIFVNTVLPNIFNKDTYSSVQVNHYDTAYCQMEYLINKGHRNICMLISSMIDTSIYHIRLKAWHDAVKNYNLDQNLVYIAESDYCYDRAYRELTDCLSMHPDITAICSIADVMVMSALRAVHDAGRIPGKDIDIISIDGMDSLQYCVPSITTFAQPQKEMMNYVYDLLMGLINKNQQHQHITFQTRFMKGESCCTDIKYS